MADSFIQVAPDDSGKKLQTFQNTVGGQVVQAEAVTLVNSSGTEITSLTVTGPLTDTQLRAAAVPVSLAAETTKVIGTINVAGSQTIATTNAGTFAVQVTTQIGAANTANNQVSISSAATLVAARVTRRYVIIRNLDTSVSGYVGVATVTTANGMLIQAGESIRLDTTALIQGVAASGTIVFAYAEVYD